MTEQEVTKRMAHCYNALQKREARYRRDFSRYMNNGASTEDVKTIYGQVPYGYFLPGSPQEDLGVDLAVNALRSCVDTIVSKIAQTKMRPFPNPINGSFQTRKVCRILQKYFDQLFEQRKIYDLGQLCAQDALVFEFGAIWHDPDEGKIRRIMPFMFYADPAEYSVGELTYCFVDEWYYPASLCDPPKDSQAWAKKVGNPSATFRRTVFYDLKGGEKWVYLDNVVASHGPTSVTTCPVSLLWYNQPVKGMLSLSFMDSQYPLQLQVDSIATRIHSAIENSPFNFVLVPAGQGIKKSMISNRASDIYEYIPGPSGGNPIQVVTPPFMDQEWLSALDKFVSMIFSNGGVSQLSAQSVKPAGVDSGKALDTLQNVESERFQAFVNQTLRFYMDIAIMIIQNSPPSELVLKSSGGIKWKDVQDSLGDFSLQFGMASALSKEPSKKMEEVQQLIAMNLLPGDMAASSLQFPDLEKVFSTASASYDDCEAIIERAVEKHEFDFYEVVDIKLLYKLACNKLMQLDASEEKASVMLNLVDFIKSVKMKIDAINNAANPPQPPAQNGQQGGQQGSPGNMAQTPQVPPQGGPPNNAQPMPGPQGPQQ